MYYTAMAMQLVLYGAVEPHNTSRCEALPCGRPHTASLALLGEPAFFSQAAIAQVKTTRRRHAL